MWLLVVVRDSFRDVTLLVNVFNSSHPMKLYIKLYCWIAMIWYSANCAVAQTDLVCPDSASYSYTPSWNWWSKPTETGYNADDWRPYLSDFPVAGTSSFRVDPLPHPFIEYDGYTANTSKIWYQNDDDPSIQMDIMPQDGWVCVKKDFGAPPDPSRPGFLGKGVADPYFVLYNRYTGIMRIFLFKQKAGSSATEVTANSAVLKISYNDDPTYMSASLSFYAHEATAIDTFRRELDVHIALINEWIEMRGGQWFMAEVPIAYDPCVCRRNHEGVFNDPKWIVELRPILKSTLGATLKGKIGPGPGTPILNSGGDVSSSSSLQYLMGDLSKPNKAGKKIYESISGYTDMIDASLEKFDKGAKTKITKSDSYKDIKAFADILPYVGYAVGIIDFFVSGGSKSKSAAKAVTPIAGTLDAFIEGSIETGLFASKFDITVPGTERYDSDRLDPLSYNYPLGVLNLMDTPELEYVDYQYDRDLSGTSVCAVDASTGDQFMRQYHLKNPLRFAMNPMAGLKIKSLEAEIVYTLGNHPQFSGYAQADTNQRISMPGDMSSWVMGYGPMQFRMPSNYWGSFPNQLAEGGITINAWAKESTTSSRGRNDMSTIYFGTGYLPASCMQNQSVVLAINNRFSPEARYNPRFALRVKAIFERADADENTEDVVFINTYAVKVEAHPTCVDPMNTYGFTFHPCVTFVVGDHRYRRDIVLRQMRSALNPSGPAFPLGILSPDLPNFRQDVTIPAGTVFSAETTIFATRRILVSENVSNVAGVNVTLMAPEIRTVPGAASSIFRPGFRAISGTDAIERFMYGACADASPYSNVMTNTALNARCADSLHYRPRIIRARQGAPSDPTQTAPAALLDIVESARVYPNPFTDNFTLDFQLKESAQVTVELTNALGQTIRTCCGNVSYAAGSHSMPVDGRGLAPGTYFAKIMIDGAVVKTVPLMKVVE
jgi:hypothetical protein